MKIDCQIIQNRLALGFDDVHFIYIRGSYYEPSLKFFVKRQDFFERDDMSSEEKEYALKAIDEFNKKNVMQIAFVDD
ncbi:MAG: hypothetical protein IJK49_11065 [Prevotella sp.]|nr:hypothetical protein [Prevotella sp.]